MRSPLPQCKHIARIQINRKTTVFHGLPDLMWMQTKPQASKFLWLVCPSPPVSEVPFEVKVQSGRFHDQLIFQPFPWFSIDSHLPWSGGNGEKKEKKKKDRGEDGGSMLVWPPMGGLGRVWFGWKPLTVSGLPVWARSKQNYLVFILVLKDNLT